MGMLRPALGAPGWEVPARAGGDWGLGAPGWGAQATVVWEWEGREEVAAKGPVASGWVQGWTGPVTVAGGWVAPAREA